MYYVKVRVTLRQERFYVTSAPNTVHKYCCIPWPPYPFLEYMAFPILFGTMFITLWSRNLLEQATVTKLARKFLAFYGMLRFISVFTKACHWFLSSARYIQSTPFHLISIRSIPILYSIYAYFFQVVSSHQVFRTLPCVLHTTQFLSSLIWSPE